MLFCHLYAEVCIDVVIIESKGMRTRVGYITEMKCGKLSKYNKNEPAFLVQFANYVPITHRLKGLFDYYESQNPVRKARISRFGTRRYFLHR